MRSHTRVESKGNIGRMAQITKRTMILCLDDAPLSIVERPRALAPR